MRYLIVTDMHGNWDAFEAVFQHIEDEVFDVTLVLGDLVGYGASPNEIVEAVHRLPGTVHVIRGNHDKVASGIDPGYDFNHAALAAAQWTYRALTDENRSYVYNLPEGPVDVGESIFICHGSPLDEDYYLFTALDAGEVFAEHEGEITFFGHTHVACAFIHDGRSVQRLFLRDSGSMALEPGHRYLLNPGSVGQPRDRDPRACYMTYDSATRKICWRRIEYPIDAAQRRILAVEELPEFLAMRLALGV